MKFTAVGSALLTLCAVGSIASPASNPQTKTPKQTGLTQFCVRVDPFAAQHQQAAVDYKDGMKALQAKDYVSAETSFRLSLSNLLNGATYLGLAEALVGQGRTADARQAYRLLFHPDAHNSWGGSYYPKAQLEYALLLNENGQWAEAVDMYEKALPNVAGRGMATINAHFDPSVPQPTELEAAAHLSLGFEANWNGGDFGPAHDQRAFEEYTKALQLEPDWDVANYCYGAGWQRLSPADRAKFGTVQQAKAHLQKAEKTGNASVKAAAQKALKNLG